jgi:hypothetical protein
MWLFNSRESGHITAGYLPGKIPSLIIDKTQTGAAEAVTTMLKTTHAPVKALRGLKKHKLSIFGTFFMHAFEHFIF